jgi:glutathione S-transferase
MNIKLYNIRRYPYVRRTRIGLHEKGISFPKHQLP